MSTLISKNAQIGADPTATNNFTIYQPATPDGTLRIGNGNTGITSSLLTLTSAGNLGLGTSSPLTKFVVSNSGANGFEFDPSLGYISSYNRSTSAWTRILTRASSYVFNISNSFDAMTLDSSGNLGLGVTPSASGSFMRVLQIGDSGSLSQNAGTMRYGNNFYIDSGGTSRYIRTSNASNYQQSAAGEHTWSTAPSGTAGNAISFTQAMTLDASGNLLLGTTSATPFQNNNSTIIRTSGDQIINHSSGTASGSGYLFFGYNAGGIGSITQNGTTGVLYNITSDQRLKENIQDSASASSLIDSLQVRQYDWKSDGSHQRYGFIAQELVTVAPEAVHQPANPDDMMAVDYSKLVPMLVKELQSLRARVAQLEAK